ncbi:hypothetical protein CMUS01_10980 [Colletotrichum musicola]|uniref:Uncharacterized protein n=1 Tax=Colletotrichum musicola TaxID=2175873 RepID=A0A8H6K1F6_9PEZI|nr:hypothetical protein CMUS01_10980 [Colletotrichum musicola]
MGDFVERHPAWHHPESGCPTDPSPSYKTLIFCPSSWSSRLRTKTSPQLNEAPNNLRRIRSSSLTTSTRAVVDHDPRLTVLNGGSKSDRRHPLGFGLRHVASSRVIYGTLAARRGPKGTSEAIDPAARESVLGQTKATDPEMVEHLVGRIPSTVGMPHGLNVDKATRGRTRTHRKAHLRREATGLVVMDGTEVACGDAWKSVWSRSAEAKGSCGRAWRRIRLDILSRDAARASVYNPVSNANSLEVDRKALRRRKLILATTAACKPSLTTIRACARRRGSEYGIGSALNRVYLKGGVGHAHGPPGYIAVYVVLRHCSLGRNSLAFEVTYENLPQLDVNQKALLRRKIDPRSKTAMRAVSSTTIRVSIL